MIAQYSYQRLLETSRRANWQLDEVIPQGTRLDFSRPFLPESFARVQGLEFLSPDEQRLLNQIRGHGYLAMFQLVERCILPYIDEHTPSHPGQDAARTPAMVQFAAEEAKHIELFTRFRLAFTDGFGVACGFIGPAEDIGAAVRDHGALGLAIFVLGIEWATQQHYLESVRDDQSLDPQFKSLLKHHWLEESQHIKLDEMLFFELAASASADEIDQAIADFLDIGGFIDGGLAQQTALDLASLESAMGRRLLDSDRATFTRVQHQAMRWTFLGTAMVNPGFLDAVGAVTKEGRTALERVAQAFC